MPHNSLLFWKKLLRKKLPPNCLSRLKYSCFGLGDSTYLKYDEEKKYRLHPNTIIDPVFLSDSTGLRESLFADWTSLGLPHSSMYVKQTSSFQMGKRHTYFTHDIHT